MGLKSMLTGKWFTRIVLVSWIICAVSILVVFKNMEFIVHGQLYDFGLIFSPVWADSYRFLTWMIFLFTGLPIALSGIALVTSFLNVEERNVVVPMSSKPPLGATKVGSTNSRSSHPTRPVNRINQVEQPVKEPIRRADAAIVGKSCPECKKVFSKALVMLDFRGGSNRLVSVCPYCNTVLGYTTAEKSEEESYHVKSNDKKITQ